MKTPTDYREATLMGQSWQRCSQIVIENPHKGAPVVRFDEERVLALQTGRDVRTPSGSLALPFDPSKIIPLRDPIAAETRPVFIIANKVDLIGDKSKLLPLLETLHGLWPKAEIYPISALTGEGLPQLLAGLKAVLPEGEAQFPEDQLSTLPMRFMASEIVREKLFLSLRQELPYHTAVDIEAWEEDPETNHVTIHAVVYVGRPSHKAMVIGRAGQNLKQVGQTARMEIMDLLEKKVHLQLVVKVRENWVDDVSFLHVLGLGTQE